MKDTANSIKPNFFLVGVPKAGTTSVSEFLKMHPQIFISDIKEPNYFVDMGSNCPTADKVQSWEEYLALFSTAASYKAVGECSVSYFHSPTAAQKIKDEIGNAKIIAILRNPAERTFSHWLMDVREGYQQLNFWEAIAQDIKADKKGFCYSHMYIDCSIYSKAIQQYQSLFGVDNVLVLFYEDMKKDMNCFMKKIYSFLNVDTNVTIDFAQVFNEAAEPKNKFVKLLFHNMLLRVWVKKITSKALRQTMRKRLMKKAPKKELERDEYKKLWPYFCHDIKEVERILKINLVEWRQALQ